MAVAVSSAAGSGQWPGTGTGQLALTGGQYYCPLPAETLVQAPGTGQTTDQLVYAATAGVPQPGSYQTVDLSDGAHHLVAAGQSSEVILVIDIFTQFYLKSHYLHNSCII